METRNTQQRTKILDYLISEKTHPTAERVYKGVKNDMPEITLATVYRNLNLLSKQDKILKLEVNGEFRFDAEINQHQHLICNDCGKILDGFQEEISTEALRGFKNKEFKAEKVSILYYGKCSKCEA